MSLVVIVSRSLAIENLVLPDCEIASRHVPTGFAGSWLPLLPKSLVVHTLLHGVLLLSLESKCEVRCFDLTGLCLSCFLRRIVTWLRWCFKALLCVVGVLLGLQWVPRTESRSITFLRRGSISSRELALCCYSTVSLHLCLNFLTVIYSILTLFLYNSFLC